MDRRKIELIATAVLVVIFFVTFGNLLKALKVVGKPAPKAAEVQPAYAEQPQAPVIRPIIPDINKIKDKQAEWGRDPFVFSEEAPEKALGSIDQLSLMGITTNVRGGYTAIINNEFVSAGAVVGTFTVIQVDKDSVVVTDGRERFVLNIQEK